MNENLNLVEILKDCPKGMELDCTMYDNVTLKSVSSDINCNYPICIETKCGFYTRLTKYGQNVNIEDAKCIIFPKGKNTWEGFQIPFIAGDIVFYNDTIAIFKEWGDETLFRAYVAKGLNCEDLIGINTPLFGKSVRNEIRFATEEEKQILFKALEENGYKWNSKTKTLEKLIVPKFKVGDKVVKKGCSIPVLISEINDGNYYSITENSIGSFKIKEQDNWELVPNKFDPKTLQHFDKVLGTDALHKVWYAGFFSHIDTNRDYPFAVGSRHYRYCIPYNNDTKHLTGKSGKVPEFYRYWEK